MPTKQQTNSGLNAIRGSTQVVASLGRHIDKRSARAFWEFADKHKGRTAAERIEMIRKGLPMKVAINLGYPDLAVDLRWMQFYK